jgi:alpha-tubulin suppressor-like RCC1 family protein
MTKKQIWVIMALVGLGACAPYIRQRAKRPQGPVISFPANQGVSIGYDRSCVVQDEGLKCWGYFNHCDSSLSCSGSDRQTALTTVHTSNIYSVAVGANVVCYMTIDQKLRCWGSNEYSELARQDGFGGYSPYEHEIFPSGVQAVSARNRHICAIRAGALYCWGDNQFGQVGNGAQSRTVESPYEVFSAGVTAVATGNHHTCAIVNEALLCWGANWDGQIGNGLRSEVVLVPYTVFADSVSEVHLGYSYSCALKSGALYCWGANWQGAIGTGEAHNSVNPYVLNPTVIFASGVTQFSASNALTCAIVRSSPYCWGTADQVFAQFNLASTEPSPKVLSSGLDYIGVSSGNDQLCLTRTSGTTCYGAGVP